MRFNIFGPVGTDGEAGPSTPASSAKPAPTRYETVLQDEEQYQAKQYQTYDEVPGCMQLL